MSSRLRTRRFKRLGLVDDRLEQLATHLAACDSLASRSVLAAPVIDGERRAQIVRDRAEQGVAQLLGLGAKTRRVAPRRELARARAPIADLPREGLEELALLGIVEARRSVRRRAPSTPSATAPAAERHVTALRAAGACPCPSPAGSPCSNTQFATPRSCSSVERSSAVRHDELGAPRSASSTAAVPRRARRHVHVARAHAATSLRVARRESSRLSA